MAISAKFEADFSQFVAAAQGAEASVKKISASGDALSSTLSLIGRIAAAVGIGFSVGAVVKFGRALLDNADAMVKLSDRTGLSIGALTELKRVSIDSGSSLDGMAAAINVLQRNIGGNDTGAAGAMKILGLNIDAIKKLSPEDQWFAVARALRGVTDQTTLVKLGTELMGRGFTETLPAIKQGFDEIDESAERTARTLDEAGDALDRFWQGLKNVASTKLAIELEGATTGLTALKRLFMDGTYFTADYIKATDDLTAKTIKLNEENRALTLSQSDLTLSTTGQSNVERRLSEDLRENQAEMKKTEEAQASLAASIAAHWDDVGVILDRVLGVDQLKAASDWADAIDALGGSVKKLSTEQLAELNTTMLEAIAVMAQNGTLTTEQSSRYAALVVASTKLEEATVAVARGLDTSTMAQSEANAETAKVPPLMAAATAAVHAYNFTLAQGAGVPSSLLRPDTQSQIHAGPAGGNVLTLPGNSSGVPRFGSGGPTGQGGLAILDRNEYVVPAGGALVRGGGSGVTVNVTVQGSVVTERELVQHVKESITRSVMQGRQLGSA